MNWATVHPTVEMIKQKVNRKESINKLKTESKMKKKILSATFVVAMMAVAGYNVYMSQAKADMSELALANLEALANGEYPKDPFKGEGPADYERRAEYNYDGSYEVWINDTVVHVYKIPTTEVDCLGFGEVKCVIGLYQGEMTYSHSEIRK